MSLQQATLVDLKKLGTTWSLLSADWMIKMQTESTTVRQERHFYRLISWRRTQQQSRCGTVRFLILSECYHRPLLVTSCNTGHPSTCLTVPSRTNALEPRPKMWTRFSHNGYFSLGMAEKCVANLHPCALPSLCQFCRILCFSPASY